MVRDGTCQGYWGVIAKIQQNNENKYINVKNIIKGYLLLHNF